MLREVEAWIAAAAGETPRAAVAALDADLVFLGETNHFVHEKGDFRIALAGPLIAAGWRTFGEELGWSDGWRVGRKLASGAPFEGLALFGDESHRRTDRDDRPTGLFREAFETYPTQAMAAEQRRFYEALRALGPGAGRPLAYFGFDIDGSPGGGYADIAAMLSEQAERPAVAAFLAGLARRPGESAREEAARLRALQRPPDLSIEVEAALAALADSLDYIAITYPAQDYEAVRPGMVFREEAMKRRAAAALSRHGRAVLMAHAHHLAKDDGLLRSGPGVGPGGGKTPSLGHHLVRERGLQAYSVWMIYGGGEDSQPMPDLPRRASFGPETLNAQLASLGAPSWLPVSAAPPALARRPVPIGHLYNQVFETVLEGQVDALWFIPEVSPLRAA